MRARVFTKLRAGMKIIYHIYDVADEEHSNILPSSITSIVIVTARRANLLNGQWSIAATTR
jgi:hypothetical protein